MSCTRVHTNDAPAAIGPYSQGYVAGDFLFTAGQVPFDPATGENNLCPEGQYVLRITGRMPGAETDDVLEIPFRLDLTSPAVEITDFSFEEIPMDEEGTMTKPVLNISFRAEDNVGVYDMFVLEINSATYNVPMSECELQDGVYSATVDYVLPVEGMNEVGVYAEDYGGNSTMVYVYSNVDQDAIVSFSTLTNAEDSWFDSFFLVEDYAGLSGILTEEALETVELGWEIRGVAWRMLKLLCDRESEIFRHIGPSCVYGPCPEGRMTCGRPYKSTREM